MKTVTKNIFSVENLERLSINWDRQTINVLVKFGGSGNMFGGSNQGYLLTIHGENSIHTTGLIEIKGVFVEGYNIARGANGENHGSTKFWNGLTNFDKIYETEPKYKITIEGNCDCGTATLCSILSAQLDFFIEQPTENN